MSDPQATPVRAVAIGGGHGQAATLRALRQVASEITAIVSVADDGGSSGRLRNELGILPPGDLRKCLVALADQGSLLARAFELRFDAGELTGHALGNLLLAALVAESTDVQEALDEAGRLLGAVGRVVPASTVPVVLSAELGDGPRAHRSIDPPAHDRRVEGQVAVMGAGAIRRVSFDPADPPVPKLGLYALGAADLVVLGPGSLYTSVIAAGAIPGVKAAIASSSGRRVYVCNLRPQDPETGGYDVADHLAALVAHGIPVDAVLCDSTSIPLGDIPAGVEVVDLRLARPNGMAHDPARLAVALSNLIG